MENWLFVDFQTLGLDPSSAVLSIGMLYAPDNLEDYSISALMDLGFYKCFEIESQNRHIDKTTLNYWKSQPKNDMKPFEGKKYSIKDVYHKMCAYLDSKNFTKNDIVWSKGMLDKFFYESVFKKYPEKVLHYQWRDSSTALYILTGDINGTIKNDSFKIKNHSLYNCAMEYKRMREALKLYDS